MKDIKSQFRNKLYYNNRDSNEKQQKITTENENEEVKIHNNK